MRIWIVDPNNMTTFLTYSQCNALAEKNITSLVTCHSYILPKDDARFEIYKIYGLISSRIIERSSFIRQYKTLRSILKGLELPLGHLQLLLKAIRSRPDVIHFHWLMIPVIDILLLRALRLLKIQVSVTIHDTLPHKRRPYHAWIFHQSYKLAHHLFVHSEQLRNEAINELNIKPDKFHVVVHGNFDDFANLKRLSAAESRARLDIPTNSPVILFLGLIKEYKGVDLLIKSMAFVLAKFPTAQLIIAGKEYKKGDFQRYDELIEQASLRPHVKTIIHFLDLEEIDMLFLSADVVALPYTKSYQSGVIFNALSYGKPVVASDTGAFRETIEPDNLGIIVDKRTPEAFGQGLIDQLVKKNQSESFAAHAQRISATKYSWQKIAEEMIKVYSNFQNGQGRE